MIEHILTILSIMVLPVVLLGGCSVVDEGPSALGQHDICQYSQDLNHPGYQSAQISYPCDHASKPFPAVTVLGGYTNVKEHMYWLSHHIVSHGYIVITITPTSVFGQPSIWETAQHAGIEKLLSENNNASSPIAGIVNPHALGVIGFSFGGSAAIKIASKLGDDLQVAIGISPHIGNPEDREFPTMTASTLLVSGNRDTTASPAMVTGIYNGLPEPTNRLFALLNTPAHTSDTESNRNKYQTLINSWLKTYLDGDDCYSSYLYGTKHLQNEKNHWFSNYLSSRHIP